MFDLHKLLEHLDLVRLVELAGTELTSKSGRNEYRGACPIHGGNNPTAFQIYRDNNNRQRWRCWSGCDRGGDAIDFVMATENLTFMETVQWLAEYANVQLADIGFTPEVAQAYAEQRQQTNLNNLTAQYFRDQLWSEEGADALAYVRGRGFRDDVIRVAGWGYSDGSNGLKKYLEAAGADLLLAHKTGLIRKDGRDFTANSAGNQAAPSGWIIYPHQPHPPARLKDCPKCQLKTWHIHQECLRHNAVLCPLRGVTYFSSRALDPVNPKDKSRNLPGTRQLYKAEVPGVREVIVCEGPADAESYRQLGFTAWALCGLGAIPEEDLHQLHQRPIVYVTLDGDHEGRQAQEKIAPGMGPLTMLVESQNGYKDANEFLQAGGKEQGISELLLTSKPVLDLWIVASKTATPYQLQGLTGEIIAMLKQLPKELEPRYLQRTQRALGMSRKELRALMRGAEQVPGDAAPILSSIKDGRLCFLAEPLGNFYLTISKEVSIIDGLNIPEVSYAVTGGLATGETFPEVEVNANEFSELHWIGKYWGARPILYIPRSKYYLFSRAVQEMSLDNMTRERVYTHTGWAVIDGERSFLTTTGRITADGFDGAIRVALNDNLQRYALPAPPTGQALTTAVHASLDFIQLGPYHVTAPVWAAIYASPFTEVKALYTLLWLYGGTRSGKSTLAHLAMTHIGQHFINGRQYHAPVGWDDTETHIEEALFAAKDTPIVIDDFAPQFQSARDSRMMHKTAQKVVRAVGNRKARGRSINYQKQTASPRGMVISTAELPLAGESTVARMIYIPIDRGDVLPRKGEPPRDALDRAQKQAEAGLYAQAYAAFIQWLAAHWERASALYLEIIEASCQFVRQEELLQDRLIDYYGLLNAGQQIALTAFHEMGVLSKSEAEEMANANRQAILSILVSQDERIAAESPVRKFFEALTNLLEKEKIYLAPRTKRSGEKFIPPLDAELVGYYDPGDNGLVYLNDLSCLAQVKTFWRGLGENFDSTRDALRRQFMQIGGLVAKHDKGEFTTTAWVGRDAKNQRLLAINPRKAADLFGAILKNGTTTTAQTLEKPKNE
jgi:5S rRNA maturation endonuclease (ribonuclease M5)